MPHRDLVVVGASAGGVEVLKQLVAGLPKDLAAAVLIVLHIAPSSPSVLPRLLARRSTLPVRFAEDDEPIAHGVVYVAPPDRHLVVEPGRLRLTRAPRENHSRPAIDPLFRSAALAYGRRAIGVILSGRLDDGTAGLWAIKERGGIAVVQDPDDAAHADMPRNALAYTTPDHLVRGDQVGALIGCLVRESIDEDAAPPASRELELEVKIAMEDSAFREGIMQLGPVSPYTCPECHGSLVRHAEGGIPRFRCHTGHAFSLDSLLAVMTESVESALWSALRAVEESVMLLREAGANGDPRFESKAREAETRAEAIRTVVLRHQALSLEAVRRDG